MTNEIRSLILGLNPVNTQVRWAEWIHPEFSIGSSSSAESAARLTLLGNPKSREEAEFAATILCRAAMDLDMCRAALGRVFGKISFCFDLRERLVAPGYSTTSFNPSSAATEAFLSVSRIAVNHEESDKLSRSERFSQASEFHLVAISATILAISSHSRILSETEPQ